MPSFADSVVLFILALILFGPKKLPELARTLGKLMAEFRRASNEFKYQMEEELRVTEVNEEKKKQAERDAAAAASTEPKPIAQEGELSLMPPSTGLPTEAGGNADPVISDAPSEVPPAPAVAAEPELYIPDEFPEEPVNHPAPHNTQESHG